MRLHLLTIFAILTIPSFGQRDYSHFVNFVESRLTDPQLTMPEPVEGGIKSLIYYSCSDTIFNDDNCTKIHVIYFESKSNIIHDTIYSEKFFTSRKIEKSRDFVKVTETSFNHRHELVYKVDSLVLNEMKKPLERYENGELKTKWTYDNEGRIVTKLDNLNNIDRFETTNISYKPDNITRSTETRNYDVVSNHIDEFQFDPKSKLILRENIFNRKTKFLYKDKKIHKDSIIFHEPLELSRYVIYGYTPPGTLTAAFHDTTLSMTVIRKLDKKKRITDEYVLNEKGDTVSYETYKYHKRKIVKISYQDGKFFSRTTEYLNDKGDMIKRHEETSDPAIWETKEYSNKGLVTKKIYINYGFRRMSLTVIEK